VLRWAVDIKMMGALLPMLTLARRMLNGFVLVSYQDFAKYSRS